MNHHLSVLHTIKNNVIDIKDVVPNILTYFIKVLICLSVKTSLTMMLSV